MGEKNFRRPPNYTEGLPQVGKKLREKRMKAVKSAPKVIDELEIDNFSVEEIYGMETGRIKKPLMEAILSRHYEKQLPKHETVVERRRSAKS